MREVNQPKKWIGREAVYTRVAGDIVRIDKKTHRKTVFTSIKVYEQKHGKPVVKKKLAICFSPDDVFRLYEDRLKLNHSAEREVLRAMDHKL